MFGSDLSTRVLVKNVESRKLLLRFAGGSDCDGKKELTDAEAENLRSRIRSDMTFLEPVFEWIDEQGGEFFTSAPQLLQRLLKSISKASPITGFVLRPSVSVAVLTRLANGENLRSSPSALSILYDNCPCIASLIQSDGFDTELSKALQSVFAAIRDKCSEAFEGARLLLLRTDLHCRRE